MRPEKYISVIMDGDDINYDYRGITKAEFQEIIEGLRNILEMEKAYDQLKDESISGLD